MKYRYVIFPSKDGNALKPNPDGYNTICWADIDGSNECVLVPRPVSWANKIVRILYSVHNSEAINNKIVLPFKSLWFPLYFRDKNINNKPYCFVFQNHRIPVSYLDYLKAKYPHCKLVLIHRDLLDVCYRANKAFPLNPIWDLEYSIDRRECDEFGMHYMDEFESKIDLVNPERYPTSDVFFAGLAKDRLPKLLSAYKIFKERNLNVFYYITGVKKENQVNLPGIVYADRNMTYRDMLYHSINTKCLLEINYGNALGFTSRFLEAVIYNKLLITNNMSVKDTKFYKTGNIQCIKDVNEIDVDFITRNNKKIEYNYKDEFSPLRLIEKIDIELSK